MFQAELKAIIATITECIDELDSSVTEAAESADLHPSTLYKLFRGETKDPKFKTIWKLAKLVGMECILSERQQVRRRKGA